MGWLSNEDRPSRKKRKARAFYNKQNFAKAEPLLVTLARTKRDGDWAKEVLTRLYYNTKQFDKSLEIISELVSIKSTPELYERMIAVACKMRNSKKVVEAMYAVTWTHQNEALLIEVYNQFRSNSEVKSVFLQKAWPVGLNAPVFVKADILFDVGEVEKSSSLVKEIQSEKIVSRKLVTFCRKVCEKVGNFGASEKILFDFLLSIEGEVNEKKSMMDELCKSKRYAEAISIAKSILEQDPSDVDSLRIVLKNSANEGAPEEAIEAFRKLESSSNISSQELRFYANAALKSSSPDCIHNSVMRLLKLSTDATATIRSGFLALHDSGQIELANEILEQVKTTKLEFDLNASLAFNQGDDDRAVNILDSALEKFPNHIPFLMKRGILYESNGRLEKAICQFDSILKINPSHHSAIDWRIKCGTKIWDEDFFFHEISLLTARHPEKLNHQFSKLNFVLRVKKDLELAYEIISTCLHHHPDNQRAHTYHALILSMQGKHQQAKVSIGQSIIRWPNSNDVLITASQIEKNSGFPKNQIEKINSMLSLHNMAPVFSTSPTDSITPEFLGTATDKEVDDPRKVSIIMTTYKRDPLLQAAISSILNQTYQNLELIIVDDCSPDDNFDYLQKIAKDDPRIRVFQMESNGGTYLAKNFGMTKANGDFIGFMDSDDYCHAERIELQVSVLDANPEAMGVTHEYFRIDESSNVEFRGIGALRMACISLVIRRQVVDEIGFFDSLRVGADTEYIERIEAKYGKERRLRIRIPSMFMMLHTTSLTGGGPFHISWRSVSGHRLQHHRSFRSWHKKIRLGETDAYVPREIVERPFEVPELMIAKPMSKGGF